jgi:hypothetical protein
MRRLAPLAAGLAAALAATAAAAVEPAPGARLGTDAAAVAESLAADGWTLTKYEREGRSLEVYAEKDGRRVEMKLDPDTGVVREIEEERR